MDKLSDLISLQIEQRRHDEAAHSDILCLPTQRRLTHMTLHFAKYVGDLAQEPNDQKFQRVLIDALIISFASANSLNMNLAARIREATGACSYDELRQLTHTNVGNVKEKIFLGLAAAAGVMAKACESLDHMEDYDFRGTLERQVTQIACLVLAAVSVLKLNFVYQIRDRWAAVERKSIFSVIEDSQSVADTKTHVALLKTGSR